MEAENKRLTKTLEEVRSREEKTAAMTVAVGEEAERLRRQATDLETQAFRSGTGRVALRALQMMVQRLRTELDTQLRTQVVELTDTFTNEVDQLRTKVAETLQKKSAADQRVGVIRELYAHEWLQRREQNRRLLKLWGPLRVVCWVPDTQSHNVNGNRTGKPTFVADENDSAVRAIYDDGRQQQFSFHRVCGPNHSQSDVLGEYEDTIRMAMMGQRGCLFHMFPADSFVVEGKSHGQTERLLEHLTTVNEHTWYRLFALREIAGDGDGDGGTGNDSDLVHYKFSVSYVVIHCGEVYDLLSNDDSTKLRDTDVQSANYSCVEVTAVEEALQLTQLGSRKRVDLAVSLLLLLVFYPLYVLTYIHVN